MISQQSKQRLDAAAIQVRNLKAKHAPQAEVKAAVEEYKAAKVLRCGVCVHVVQDHGDK